MFALRTTTLRRFTPWLPKHDRGSMIRVNQSARRWVCGVLGLMALGSVAGFAWSRDHKLIWNESNSLPEHIYYADKTLGLKRLGLIAFYPRPGPIMIFHFGNHPVAFVKRIYGVTGDLVTHGSDNFVSVNGVKIARMKPFTYFHERLTPGPIGAVPRGCFYVGSPHVDGFDSRYMSIGWVCKKDIIGGARVVL